MLIYNIILCFHCLWVLSGEGSIKWCNTIIDTKTSLDIGDIDTPPLWHTAPRRHGEKGLGVNRSSMTTEV